MIYEDRQASEMEIRTKKLIGEGLDAGSLDSKILQCIDYDHDNQDIISTHTTEEFTCLCPFSGLPDFATVVIEYIPKKKCVELKSLKYYLLSFRQIKIYHEDVVNRIISDLKSLLDPKWIKITAVFKVRGGINTTIVAEDGCLPG